MEISMVPHAKDVSYIASSMDYCIYFHPLKIM